MKWLRTLCLATAATAVSVSALAAVDGEQVLSSQCASCHALKKPEKLGMDHIWERKGPDLYYAGNKFQQDWLVEWLQAPKTIRPSGEFYHKHVKAGANGDEVDTGSLTVHPKLDKDTATAVAHELMELKSPGIVEAGAFKGGAVSPAMGAMQFGKFLGCAACHQNAAGQGGLSGPELYTAGKRLQADYVYSYIKDPQKIDPRVWMPTLGLPEPKLQQLTGYIMQLTGEAPK